MESMKFGCQAYTWQMSFDRFAGDIPHIADTVKRAGFAGVEFDAPMLGRYRDDPPRLAGELGGRGLSLAGLCISGAWSRRTESVDERAEADALLSLVARFPGARMVVGHVAGTDRSHLRERQECAIACLNALGERCVDRGVRVSFHPNSVPGSVFRLEDDYRRLMDGLDPRRVLFAPDAGHIAAGGMDPVTIFARWRDRIDHVHFKDLSAGGEWTAMGKGVIDFPALVSVLRGAGYTGWIDVEEESEYARANPDAATMANGAYTAAHLFAPAGL